MHSPKVERSERSKTFEDRQLSIKVMSLSFFEGQKFKFKNMQISSKTLNVPLISNKLVISEICERSKNAKSVQLSINVLLAHFNVFSIH